MRRVTAHSAPSDALVVFGVTGDLAHKMIFPALYAMVKRGVLTVPVIGVASSPWTVSQLRTRATESIKESGVVVERRVLARCCPCCTTCPATTPTPTRSWRSRTPWERRAAPRSTSRSRLRSSRR